MNSNLPLVPFTGAVSRRRRLGAINLGTIGQVANAINQLVPVARQAAQLYNSARAGNQPVQVVQRRSVPVPVASQAPPVVLGTGRSRNARRRRASARAGVGGVVGGAIPVPLTRQVQTFTIPNRVQQIAPGVVRVTGTEYLGFLPCEADKTKTVFIAMSPRMAPWLSQESQGWGSYRFERLALRFDTKVSTGYSGVVALAPFYEFITQTDEQKLGIMSASQAAGAASGPVWSSDGLTATFDCVRQTHSWYEVLYSDEKETSNSTGMWAGLVSYFIKNENTGVGLTGTCGMVRVSYSVLFTHQKPVLVSDADYVLKDAVAPLKPFVSLGERYNPDGFEEISEDELRSSPTS